MCLIATHKFVAHPNECVNALAPYAAQIPATLVPDYVLALTQTYVGSIGNSYRFSRTDFYANGAALIIPKMFEAFDDTAADAFIDCIKVNTTLRRRIQNPSKLNRLRSLANIVLERVSAHHSSRGLLGLLVDTTKEPEFIKLINTQK